jgi:hypothetical protein
MIAWYIPSGFGSMHQEKSGNPGLKRKTSDREKKKKKLN